MVVGDAKKQSYISIDKTLDDYFGYALNLPRLSKEETLSLIKLAQVGDEHSLERLISSNIRLIISVAKDFSYRASNMEIMDLIQEGIIGFTIAVKKYDETKSELSTYATIWIKAEIQKAISNQNDTIKKSSDFNLLVSKYHNLLNNFLIKGEEVPSDKMVCEILKISLNKLNDIKNATNLEPLSTEASFISDESMKLENIIMSNIDDYKDVNASVDTKILLVVLKKILSPVQYFILYHHTIFTTLVLEDIGKLCGLGVERIRQIEVNAMDNIKPYLHNDRDVFKRILKGYQSRKINIHNVNTAPISPIDVTKYLYIKPKLTGIEKKLYFLIHFDELKYSDTYAARKLKIDIKTLNEIKNRLDEKIKTIFDDNNKFKIFSDAAIKKYGSRIFDCLKEYESKNVLSEFKNLDVDFLLSASSLLTYEEDLLKRYFNYHKQSNYSNFDIEKDVYLTVFGFKDKLNIPSNKLYITLLKHKEDFSIEEYYFLECLLKRNNIRLFLDKYPDSKLINNYKFLITKLEMLYFGIDKLFTDRVTKKEYLEVKDKYLSKLTDRRIKLLDLYFGINDNPIDATKIAQLLGEEESKTSKEIYTAIEYVRSLYYSRSKGINIDKNKYLPYVLEKKYEFTDETREVLKLYLLNDFSYEDISQETGLSRNRVSNIVNDGLEKIDLYRFNIIKHSQIDISLLMNFFDSETCHFDDLTKGVVIAKKHYLKTYQEIIDEFKITKAQYDRIITTFNMAYEEHLVRDVALETRDIINEIEQNINESVISLEDKKILSMYMGLDNRYNDGKKYTQREIAKILAMSEDSIRDRRKKAIVNISLSNISLKKPDLVYLDISVLNEKLKDARIPISKEDKDILCYLFGFNGFEIKTLDELSQIIGMKPNHLKRRYKSIICNIYKYINQEKVGVINYKDCILPNLKFFSKRDSILLREYYENNLSREEIAKKYNLTIFVVNRLLNRASDKINRILNNEENNLFDYEFYRNCMNSEELPYDGNLSLVNECFSLLVGENTMESLSLEDIASRLNLSCSIETINRHIKLFVLSIYKYKMGIKKYNLFSNEEIEAYYFKNKESLSVHELNCFSAYFNSKFIRSEFASERDCLNEVIVFDLLKERNPQFFDFESANVDEVDFILTNYYYDLEPITRRTLMLKYDLNERNYMSKAEISDSQKLVRRMAESNKKN